MRVTFADATANMPVFLRGHHFLCMLTYQGAGYTADFVRNMTDVVAGIKAGRAVVLTDGPDDICAGLTQACRIAVDHNCHATDTLDSDRMAIAAVGGLLNRDLRQPAALVDTDIAMLRRAYREGTIRAACHGCSWKSLCDSIAGRAFAGTML